MLNDGRVRHQLRKLRSPPQSVYWPYSNIQPIGAFRGSLSRLFQIDRSFPTSHNWWHSEPNRWFMQASQMHLNFNIPLISPVLAVEYFFICSAIDAPDVKRRF